MEVIYHVCVECDPPHVDNCRTCFGWGLKKGTMIPLSAHEVDTLTECDPCPECHGNLKNDQLIKMEKRSRQITPISFSVESSPGTLKSI